MEATIKLCKILITLVATLTALYGWYKERFDKNDAETGSRTADYLRRRSGMATPNPARDINPVWVGVGIFIILMILNFLLAGIYIPPLVGFRAAYVIFALMCAVLGWYIYAQRLRIDRLEAVIRSIIAAAP